MSEARDRPRSAANDREHVEGSPEHQDHLSAAGPLGKHLWAQFAELPDQNAPAKGQQKEKRGRGPRLQAKHGNKDFTGLEQANSLVMLRQAAFANANGSSVQLPPEGEQALLRWAQSPTDNGTDTRDFSHGLGQETDLLKHAAERRTYGMRRLKTQGKSVIRVRLTPEWRMIVGHGERGNAYEIGLALHGTYGWPVIPGSGLKGLASAFARVHGDDLRPADSDDSGAGSEELTKLTKDYREIFGTDLLLGKEGKRLAPEARKLGQVRFLDALPDGAPATVSVDVLTPHEKPYYDDTLSQNRSREHVFPGEHHQPVPVQFLTITAGTFVADLVGDDDDLTSQAACWLKKGADQLGIGAKTAAGYGYMKPASEEL